MQSDVGKMELNIRSTENTKRENTPRLGTSVIFVNFVVKNQGRRRRKHSTSPEIGHSENYIQAADSIPFALRASVLSRLYDLVAL
jgi:hypothetical protein